MDILDRSWLLPAVGRSPAFRAQRGPWWQQGLVMLRAPVWPAILAALALLIAFHQVLLEAVHQGDLRRKATAVKVDGLWRCNALPGRLERESCLMRMNGMPVIEVTAGNSPVG